MKLVGTSLTKFTWVLSATTALSACQKPAKDFRSQSDAIIGKDQRQISLDDSPRIGAMVTSTSRCNAFLIDQNILMSAAHCIEGDPRDFASITYETLSFEPAKVVELVLYDAKKDVVAYALDTKFDSNFELSSLTSSTILLQGIDSETGLLKEQTCDVFSDFEDKLGAVYHDCDTTQGISGAPMIQDGKVVAVHLGANSSSDSNIAFNLDYLFDDSVDLGMFDINSEWGPHIRSPHIRSPHVRLPFDPNEWKQSAINKVASLTSNSIAAQARNDGWTRASCTVVAAGVIGAVSVGYGSAVCAALTVGAPVCVAFLAASGPAIVTATCAQLCTDRHLADCR